jgi:hypothetical protein
MLDSRSIIEQFNESQRREQKTPLDLRGYLWQSSIHSAVTESLSGHDERVESSCGTWEEALGKKKYRAE